MEAIQLLPIADLAPYLNGGSVVAFDAGPDGNVFVVIALKPLDYRTGPQNGPDMFAKTVPAQPQRYRILEIRDSTVIRDVTIESAPFNAHFVQPVGDDFLLVCARSVRRGPNSFERNGRFFDADGQFQREILLGDGIESVQVTHSGIIWTSFFDEGIFGNYGWNDPVGASGLVAWDRDGQSIYQFEPPPGLDRMCDCYALNVESDESTWCCYDTEFPLVRLRQFKVDGVWQMPIAGSSTFAVWAGHAVFAGGYHEEHHYSLFALPEKRDPQLLRQFAFSTPEGAEIKGARVAGRGDSLWLLHGSEIYQFRVADAF